MQIIDSADFMFGYGIPIKTIPDNVWHYICIDLYDGLKKYTTRTEEATNFNLISVSLNFLVGLADSILLNFNNIQKGCDSSSGIGHLFRCCITPKDFTF